MRTLVRQFRGQIRVWAVLLVLGSLLPGWSRAQSYQPFGEIVDPQGGIGTRSVAQQGNYAYVLSRDGLLSVYNTSVLSNASEFVTISDPVTTASIENGGGLLKRGNYLYAFGSLGIDVFDISKPEAPQHLGLRQLPALYNLVEYGTYLIGVGAQMYVIGFDGPQHPYIEQTVSLGRSVNAYGVAARDGFAYVSSWIGESYNLQVFDISAINDIAQLGSFQTSSQAYHIKTINNFLVECRSSEMALWSLNSPGKPEPIQTIAANGRVCEVDGDRVITNGLVHRPTANGFVEVTTFQAGGSQADGFPYGSTATNNHVFLAQSARVLILDAQDQVLEPGVTFDPTSLDFGGVLVGGTSDLNLKISNSGDAALSIEVVTLTGQNPNAFTVVSGGGTGRLLPGEARDVVIRFAPDQTANFSAQVSVTSNAPGSPHTVPVSGSGVAPAVSLTPATYSFPATVVGQNAQQTFVLENTGTGPLTIEAINLGSGGNQPFTIQSGGQAGTLAPGASRNIVVHFAPTTLGTWETQLSVSSNAAGSPHTASISGSSTQAGIELSTDAITFPATPIGASVQRTVSIENVGNAPLTISGMQIVDVGAAAKAADADDFSIVSGGQAGDLAPGASRTVTIRFTASTVGASEAALRITTNAPGSPHQVALSGTGVAPPMADLPESVTFAATLVGNTDDQTIQLSNSGGATLNVTSIALQGPQAAAFTIVSGGGAGAIEPGASRNIVVRFAPTATGTHAATLVVASNDPDSPSQVALSGVGRQPGVTLSTTSVAFGDVGVGQTGTASVVVTNSGTGALTISSVGLNGPNAALFTITGGGAAGSLPAGQERTIQLAFSPNAVGSFEATLNIVTDAPGSPHQVSLTGSGVQATIAIEPQSVSFGNVRVGATADATVTVSNTGSAAFSVATVAIAGPNAGAFSIVSGGQAGSIGPGQARDIVVRFAPGAPGSLSATLSITGNAPGSPFDVNLSGMGVQPAVTLAPETVPFGAIKVGQNGTAEVTLTNSGTAALNIASIAVGGANAGLFTITGGGEPGVLTTQSQRVIQLTFSPAAAGTFNATLNVTSDAPGSPHQVALSGSGVQGAIELAPATVAFGSVGVGGTKNETVVVENTSTVPVEIASVTLAGTNPGQFVIVEGGAAGTLAAGATRDVVVQFKPTVTGAFSAELQVASDAPGGPKTAALSGTGVQGALSAEPASVIFAATPAGSTVQQSITVTNSGTAPVAVSQIAVTGSEAFAIVSGGSAVTLGPGENVAVTVSFTPAAGGSYVGALEVTNDASEDPLSIGLSGTGLQAGLAVAPSPLNFGSVGIGSSDTLNVTLTNTGNAALQLVSVGFTGTHAAAFSVVAGSTTGELAAGASRTLTLQFAPTAAGAASATLEVASSAPGSPATVPVSGEGIAALATLTPTALDFETVAVGSTADQTLTLENTGTTTIILEGITIGGEGAAAFSVVSGGNVGTVDPGQSRSIGIRFAPEATGAYSAQVELTGNLPAGVTSAPLTGSGVQGALRVSPSFIDFPETRVEATADLAVTLENSGTDVLEIDLIEIGGADASAFVILEGGEAGILEPQGQRLVRLRFRPLREGDHTATLRISNNVDEVPATIAMTGVGVLPDLATIGISQETLDFGTVGVGENAVATVDLSSTGAAPVVVSGLVIIGTNAGSFQIVDGSTGPIEAGVPKTVAIQFVPASPGTFTAFLQITSNAFGAPHTVSLTGQSVESGIAATPLTLQFPETQLGGSAEADVTITNSGAEAISLNTFTLEGDDAFSIVSGGETGSLTGEASRVVTVAFSPARAGAHTGTLLIGYGDGALTLSVGLSGDGIESVIQSEPEEPIIGQPLVVGVVQNGGFVPTERLLYYRRGGELEFQQLVLTDAGGQFQGAIPAEYVTERGVDYYVRFTDGEQTVTLPPTDPAGNPLHIRVPVPELRPVLGIRPQVYRMVSVPLDLQNAGVVATLGDDYGTYDPDVWRMLRWNPEAARYDELGVEASFVPGRAFWLITRDGSDFGVSAGQSVDASDPYTIELLPGWNQIGNPFLFPVAWGAGGDPDFAVLDPPVLYDGSDYAYEQTVLQPWQGYFVYNTGDQPVSIDIQPIEAAPVATKRSRSPSDATDAFSIQLVATLAGRDLRDGQNFLVLGTEQDGHNLAEAPGVGDHVRLSVVEDGAAYARSYRADDGNGQSWELEVEAVLPDERIPTRKTVHVQRQDAGTLPDGYGVYLLDLDNGTPIPVDAGSFEVEIGRETPVRRFRLIVGTEQFADANRGDIPLVPTEFALLPNYPNPFNPATEIPYQIREKGHVMLEVFDVLGRRVARLVDQEQAAGTYRIRWDGRDAAGHLVASGAYLYRIRSGAFTATRTMILVK